MTIILSSCVSMMGKSQFNNTVMSTTLLAKSGFAQVVDGHEPNLELYLLDVKMFTMLLRNHIIKKKKRRRAFTHSVQT